MKLGRIQRRVLEIGLVGRIAHNLAKYQVGVNGAYSASEFLFSVNAYMVDRGIEEEVIQDWLGRAEVQAKDEVSFFIVNGRFADSTGGTSIYIGALIGPILDELGY